MIKDELLDLLKSNDFRSWEEPTEKVIKLSSSYNGKELSRIYIDYADHVFSNSAEALERQKSVLESDFFKAEGNIQWNFYFYYLLSKDNYNVQAASRWFHDVQNDTSYARKKVVTLDHLKSSYPFAKILKAAGATEKFTDLSNEWINILKNYDLDEVFSEEKISSYEGAIERYLQGTPIKEKSEDLSSNISTSSTVPKAVSKLTLHQYRFFPKDKPYSFSSINLLEGRNGAGKTSLLEAIELVMCGKTYRHEKLQVETAEISLDYLGGTDSEKFDPKALKKFQDRELFWYGIPPTHNRNTLYKSFNRFNFFNTDASYRFSTDDEPKAIWNNFLSLALGGKTSELSKRIDGFKDRFTPIERKLQKDVIDLNDEVEKLKQDGQSLSSLGETKEFNTNSVIPLISELGLSFAGPADRPNLEHFQGTLQRAKKYLGVLLEHFPDRTDIDLNEIEKLKQAAEDLKRYLRDFESSINEQNKQKKSKGAQQQDLKLRHEKTQRLLQYFETAQARNMADLRLQIRQSSEQIVLFQSKLNTITAQELAPHPNDKSLLSDSIKVAEQDKVNLESRKIEIERKIQAARTSLESVKAIIMEAKAIGRRYLNHASDGKCPLCDETYEREELERRVSQVALASDQLPELLDEKNVLEQNLTLAIRSYESLKRISELARLAIPDFDPNEVTIEAARTVIGGLSSTIQALISKQSEDKFLLESLVAQGFSEQEFSDLVKGLKFQVDLNAPTKNVSLLNEAIAFMDNEKNRLALEIDQVDQKVKEVVSEFLNRNAGFENCASEVEIISEASKRSNLSNKYLDDFSSLKREFPGIRYDSLLRKLHSAVSGVLTDIGDYLIFVSKADQNNAAIAQLTSQLVEKEKALSSKRRSHSYAKNALEAFNKIETEFGRDSAVKKFFDKNKPLIVEVFKAIHAPNEFENIILKEEKIYVVKNGQECELSKISTGQRTAVALSIFFGLHLSCPSAPKMILFDDPIAFIDDLNVLAFLDFLREIAIRGERQIFFATANRKLAALIRRKFEMLGNDFTAFEPGTT